MSMQSRVPLGPGKFRVVVLVYRRNTYEQYGGYNLFQNAKFKANFSIKV